MEVETTRTEGRTAAVDSPVYQLRFFGKNDAGGPFSSPAFHPVRRNGEPLPEYNQFFYSAINKIAFSPCTRYMYGFWHRHSRFVVVDLLRNTQIVFKSPERVRLVIEHFVVVGPTLVIAAETKALWLVRLNPEDGSFRLIELEGDLGQSPVYVFTEIRGRGVDVRRAIVNGNQRMRFVRLDVDAGRLQVDGEDEMDDRDCSFGLSPDGRRLYAVSRNSLTRLHVFDMTSRRWSERPIAGDLQREVNVGPRTSTNGKWNIWDFAWTGDRVYLQTCKVVDGLLRFALLSTELERPQWESLSIMSTRFLHIAPMRSEESGEEDGVAIVWTSWHHDEMIVYRLFRKTPVPLLQSAIDALRNSNLDVTGIEGFHAVMGGNFGKTVLPSVFPNMTPIPRRLE
ncbi:hypothetical protein M3Y99_01037700 [Aphelenchoides fujianensis]|nr:hypothetical protein M3Y99_01037700 [Aphelenchoides fujianensis]